MNAALLVIAKQPLPGRVKTRLTPPCTPEQAAQLAEAALCDTLEAVRATPAERHVIVLEGEPGPWLPDGFEVIPQRGGDLGDRLAAAFEDVGTPALLVGMDTPQLTSEQLASARARLQGADAVIAPTDDGGYWCVGFARPVPGAFDDVEMSTDRTYEDQLACWERLGLSVAVEGPLRDVDTIVDARAVAESAPDTRFAQAMSQIERVPLGQL